MDFDLRDVLESWPFNPDEPARNFRVLRGADGRRIIQVREPFGIQQMEYSGRPDGLKPNGRTTWLENYQDQAAGRLSFELDTEDCQKLMAEGILFYQRYLILFQMEDWEGVARDTQRNLNYFDFLKRHAVDKNDAMVVAQYLPYVLRMNAIARARLAWDREAPLEALEILGAAVTAIRDLEPTPTEVFRVESERSIKTLEALIEQFERNRPESRMEALRRMQRDAIMREDFELAARLRDEISQIQGMAAKN